MTDISWDVTPTSDGKQGEVVHLSIFENDTRDTVWMIDGEGNEVGNVRVGSIIHWLLIKSGGRIDRSKS